MKIPYIDLQIQHRKLKKELTQAFESVLESSDFILSHEVTTFEESLADYCGTKYTLGLNSGTDALFLSLKALGIGPGDEVLLPPNTFLATASSIIATGAIPVFVDVLENYMIDPAKIEEKITPRTRAIIVVHLTGKSVDFDPIIEITQRYNLFLLEDAAQAIGAEYKGKRVGSFGIAAALSLHPVKTLNACGDGGALMTNSDKLAEDIKQLRNIGLKNRNEFDLWGYNSRLDSMQAALLNVKLPYLDEWNAQRRENALFYTEHLKNVFAFVPEEEAHEKQVYHTYMIQHPKRDELQQYLEERGIGTRIHYPIPIHLQKGAAPLGYQRGDFPVCERIVDTMLSLPIHQYLRREELEYIVETVLNFTKTLDRVVVTMQPV